jgi:hypothetical protein
VNATEVQVKEVGNVPVCLTNGDIVMSFFTVACILLIELIKVVNR